MAQVQAGGAHFFQQAASGLVVADLADRDSGKALPEQGFDVMRNDVQFTVIPA